MTLLTALLGLALIGAALFDAFETIVVPRQVSRRLRLTRLFYGLTWTPYARIARAIGNDGRRESFLSFYGPISLLLLVGLWAAILIVGFATLHWSAGSTLISRDQPGDFMTDLYFSGTTFFTLGLGDVIPDAGIPRLLAVLECGMGFAFLALLIGYLPAVYQLFSRRETNVSLLDQRAGSPPSAAELVRRNVESGELSDLIGTLRDWEVWIGDLLETHLSYPTLAYFRSQHENQSWVGALCVILDVSGFVLACGRTGAERQASFTFAMARHAAGDLTNILAVAPRAAPIDRLDEREAAALWESARRSGLTTPGPQTSTERLDRIRSVYEPYLAALADYLVIQLPPWAPAPNAADNWETTAWDYTSPVPLLSSGRSPFNRGPI